MADSFKQTSHPLLVHKLTQLRQPRKKCTSKMYASIMREIGMLLAYEVTQDFELGPITIEIEHVPSVENENLKPTKSKQIFQHLRKKKPVIVPILRSGLPMAEGVRDVLQTNYIGHIGLHKTKEGNLIEYMMTLPKDLKNRDFIIVDPVMATGVTMCRAIDMIRDVGIDCARIQFVSIIVTPEALALIEAKHGKEIRGYYVTDDVLRDGDIWPGIGGVSERLFRTI